MRELVESAAARVDEAAALPASLTADELLPLGTEDARAAVSNLRGAFAWVDDWECDKRGIIGAELIHQSTGSSGAARSDAVRGATAFVRTAPNSPSSWNYHAAPAYRDAVTGEVRVVDYLLDPDQGVVDLERFARSVGRTAADVELRHPLTQPSSGAPLSRTDIELAGDDLQWSIGVEREKIAFAQGRPLPDRDAATA